MDGDSADKQPSGPPPWQCMRHGNVLKDIATECPDYSFTGRTATMRSCLNCQHHASQQPAKKVNSVFITPKQRQAYVNSARDWWNSTGRHLVSQSKNSEDTKRKFRGGGAGPAILTHGPREVVIPSGILNGKQFHNLSGWERARVLKVWMHCHTEFKFADVAEQSKDLMLDTVRQTFTEH